MQGVYRLLEVVALFESKHGKGHRLHPRAHAADVILVSADICFYTFFEQCNSTCCCRLVRKSSDQLVIRETRIGDFLLRSDHVRS